MCQKVSKEDDQIKKIKKMILKFNNQKPPKKMAPIQVSSMPDLGGRRKLAVHHPRQK